MLGSKVELHACRTKFSPGKFSKDQQSLTAGSPYQSQVLTSAQRLFIKA